LGSNRWWQTGPAKAGRESLWGGALGTGAEVAPFAIDWQDSDATIRWYELLLEECPQGQILLWQDQAPHHTSEEVEEWVEAQSRIEVIAFPKYTPEENPKEATWKDLKDEVSHHHGMRPWPIYARPSMATIRPEEACRAFL